MNGIGQKNFAPATERPQDSAKVGVIAIYADFDVVFRDDGWP
jgi:hypothetical protein